MAAPGGVATALSTVGVAPACGSAGRNTLGRSVASHGDFAHVTFESSLPAYTGRVATSLPSSTARATESAEMPAPNRAARRAMTSRCRVVTAPNTACGDSFCTSSASTGVHTSPRYGAKAASSASTMRLAPHSASCVRPASLALSVSHTASACPPVRAAKRPASPNTSAITFLGLPCLSSSTKHQNAPAMVVISPV